MKKLMKVTLFALIMFVVSTMLTGCDPAQIGQIGDQVIKIVTDTIQTIRGANGGNGGNAPAPAPAPADPAPVTPAPTNPPADTGTAAAPTGTNTDAGQCVIIVYSTPTCKYCKQAKEYLRGKGYPVVEKDLTKDPNAGPEMKSKAAAQGMTVSGVPVIDICGTMVNGFKPAEIDRVLKGKENAAGAAQMVDENATLGATTANSEELNPGE